MDSVDPTQREREREEKNKIKYRRKTTQIRTTIDKQIEVHYQISSLLTNKRKRTKQNRKVNGDSTS